METPDTGPEAIRPRPDYPPKTPPPPKKPPSPPPPQTRLGTDVPVRVQPVRGRRVMANRQGATWSLEAQPWAGKQGAAHITERLTKWGLRHPTGLDEIVRYLIATVVQDGGRHISLHLAEQDRQALILALSHQPTPDDLAATVLPRLHELGAVSCGTEITPEGRQVWALLDLAS
ncbi:hypothetical protein ACFZAR_43250 [Streptomyces sp. NPDC008222]|uniref:hypothetical protein n=1 Tax=Streptomyces sp. NPDC008222 TaxID=3364820 RepID=UPI0036EBEA44